MPCRSDYMEPTAAELEARRLAHLIIYVEHQKGLVSHPNLHAAAKHIYGYPFNHHQLAAILCKYCREMSKEEQEAIIYNGRNPDARNLADWWEDHQKLDAKRAAYDR